MVMTILEARVAKSNWHTLEQVYQEGSQYKDAGLEQSYLVQSARDPDIWRIVSFWTNREALDIMRRSMNTPRAVQMFRHAYAEPQLSIFEVVQQVNGK